MGNYFSGNKQSSLDNVVNSECGITVLVDKKSLNENTENTIQDEPVKMEKNSTQQPTENFVNTTPAPNQTQPQLQSGGQIDEMDTNGEDYTDDDKIEYTASNPTHPKNKRRRNKKKKNNVTVI